MPNAFTVFKLAPLLSPENLGDPENAEFLERLKEEGSLVEVAAEVAGLDETEVAFFEGVPQTLREGIRATIVQAATMGKGVHLQYSPAYEFGVHAWDFGGAVSIHLSGPYPDDFERPNFATE